MMKIQYYILLIVTISLICTSQILARSLDLPQQTKAVAKPPISFETKNALTPSQGEMTKKEIQALISQKNKDAGIHQKALIPFALSASDMERAATSFGQKLTNCSDEESPTICLFGEPHPTKCFLLVLPTACDIVVPTICDGLNEAPTRCKQSGGQLLPTECVDGTYATECPDETTPTVCTSIYEGEDPVITATFCESHFILTECPEKTYATHCYFRRYTQATYCQDASEATPTECPDSVIEPTNCPYSATASTHCPNSGTVPTICAEEFIPTICPDGTRICN